MGDREVLARKRKQNTDERDDVENASDEEKKRMKQPPRSAWKITAQVVVVVLLLFLLYIAIVPSPIEPIAARNIHPLPYFDGVMTPNTVLQQVTKIGLNKLPGPESIAEDREGNLYTGLNDGRVMKITTAGDFIEVARTGERLPQCGEEDFEHRCGRPLGLKFDGSGDNLIICDAYFGLLMLNIKTFKLSTLLSAEKGADDTPFRFVNDLAISKSGVIYFTDSSWKWHRRDFPYIILEGGGQGRLMSYDMNTGDLKVLLNGLFFANGVALSKEENFVLVCETAANRIVRYYLTGEKKGIYDLFSDNLPGFPDNIRNSLDGGYWVALSSARKWPFSFVDALRPYSNVRLIFSKILPKHIFNGFVKSYGLVIKLDFYGDITASLHDPQGTSISFISEVHESPKENALYLGSFKNKFLGKLRLNRKNA